MVTFRGFSKRFGRVDAVRSLTFDVAPGDVVALLGPNGSGKTTSIKAAAGLITPTAGEVLLGVPGRPARSAEARSVCAFLPQRVSFPDRLTGREVIEFYGALRGSTGARGREVLRLIALNGAGARAVGTYSGGMKQRLALGVAMLPQAPLLLLDEPTASLDPEGLSMFYDLVDAGRAKRQTVLFSSHQMGDIERLADRVVVLVDGALAASLTGADLAARLADRGVMKVRLSHVPEGLLARIQTIAPGAAWTGGELIVPAATTVRLAALEMVRTAGAAVVGLTVEDGRLDVFYREIVGGRA